MKTAFYHGIQSPMGTFWMGQDSPAEKSPAMGQSWLPDLLKSGTTAFGQYESAQAAEDAKKAAEIKAQQAQVQAQAAAQQAAATQAQLNANKIMGLDPGTFWGGLAAITALTVVGVVVANKKK